MKETTQFKIQPFFLLYLGVCVCVLLIVSVQLFLFTCVSASGRWHFLNLSSRACGASKRPVQPDIHSFKVTRIKLVAPRRESKPTLTSETRKRE